VLIHKDGELLQCSSSSISRKPTCWLADQQVLRWPRFRPFCNCCDLSFSGRPTDKTHTITDKTGQGKGPNLGVTDRIGNSDSGRILAMTARLADKQGGRAGGMIIEIGGIVLEASSPQPSPPEEEREKISASRGSCLNSIATEWGVGLVCTFEVELNC
jgi:hypothetical protein